MATISNAPIVAGTVRPSRAEIRPAFTATTADITGPGMMASPARTGL